MRPYTQHGRRHAQTGSDPIPGLGQVPFAVAYTDPYPVTITADAADHAVSIQDGSGGEFDASDDNTFANGHADVGLGDQYGIECLANGTYMVSMNVWWSGGVPGVLAVASYATSGGNFRSFWQSGRTGLLLGDTWDANDSRSHQSFTELYNTSDANPAPILILPYANVAAGTDPTVEVELVVLYLGPYAGDSL